MALPLSPDGPIVPGMEPINVQMVIDCTDPHAQARFWGTALGWTTAFKIVPDLPVIMDYVARMSARPAAVKVKALDAKLSTEHEAAAKANA